MQLATNLSKFAVLTILSFCLCVTWCSKDTLEMVSIQSTAFSKTKVKRKNARSTTSIWRTLSDEFELDHRAQSAQVKTEIRKLQADQEKFYEILEAAAPYIYFIHEQTQARGLPAELALLPVIESEFNPNDHSNKGALGLWQLMSQTARELGIKIMSGYDGRRNVPASTHAALAYLKDLGNYFKGNWYLALAAYNAGQGRIDKAIKRAGSRSFWSLSVPKETKLYVPKLLAVAAMVKNPEKYGIELPQVNDQPYFAELKLKKSVNLERIAKAIGVEIETMRTLNPDYKSGTTVAKNGVYTLLVPLERVAVAKLRLAENLAT